MQGCVAMRLGEMSLEAFKQGVTEAKCFTPELWLIILYCIFESC